MTPKELQIFYDTLEHAFETAYKRGYEDGKAGKPLENKGFALSKASKLQIKTNLTNALKKR